MPFPASAAFLPEEYILPGATEGDRRRQFPGYSPHERFTRLDPMPSGDRIRRAGHKMKLRGVRSFCIGGGYMINEFNDNICFLKIYVNSRRL
jgi:hypothetical protein